MRVVIFLLAFMLQSCSHYIFESETRLQIENISGSTIYMLSLVSEGGKNLRVLIPDTLLTDSSSKVYELEFVGEFEFVLFSDDSPAAVPLGKHKLGGGIVYAQIKREPPENNFEIVFRKTKFLR